MGINKLSDTDVFVCSNCSMSVVPVKTGTLHRNHCPYYLWSRHLDLKPGDRACLCNGLMKPVAIWARSGKEAVIIHRCIVCGILKPNRIAPDDNEKELVKLALKPFTLNLFNML
jgi:ribosome biogenesis GTPase / thiamine phosphate phosphatase